MTGDRGPRGLTRPAPAASSALVTRPPSRTIGPTESPYLLTPDYAMIWSDTGSGNVELVLPDDPVDGEAYRILHLGSNTTTISGNGNLIVGASTFALSLLGSSVVVSWSEAAFGVGMWMLLSAGYVQAGENVRAYAVDLSPSTLQNFGPGLTAPASSKFPIYEATKTCQISGRLKVLFDADPGGNAAAVIYKSTDGGVSWSSVSSTTPNQRNYSTSIGPISLGNGDLLCGDLTPPGGSSATWAMMTVPIVW